MYEIELELAIATVREACGLTSAVQGRIVAAHDAVSKADRSPVTIADLAAQMVIGERLRTAFPDDPLMAEEDSRPLTGPGAEGIAREVLALARTRLPELDADAAAAALDRGRHPGGRSGRFWMLDPVDGTKGFLRGEQYAIALALVDDGKVAVAVLGCPNLPLEPRRDNGLRGCLFAAARGAGATVRAIAGGSARQIFVSAATDAAEAVLLESVEGGHSSHDRTAAIAARLGMHRPPVRLDSQCKYGALARGEASIYLRLPRSAGYREKPWDHAPGALLLEEAGGRVSDLAGRPLDLASARTMAPEGGILATNGAIHDRVLAAARAELGLDRGHA